jgi:hypothetical protein
MSPKIPYKLLVQYVDQRRRFHTKNCVVESEKYTFQIPQRNSNIYLLFSCVYSDVNYFKGLNSIHKRMRNIQVKAVCVWTAVRWFRAGPLIACCKPGSESP